MSCAVCKDLKRVLKSADTEYGVALLAPFYLVSTEIAAKTQVDMERAKSALREHQLYCPATVLTGTDVLLPELVLI
jgi:hypothetical protein